MKRLYYARSSDDRVLLARDPIPDPDTGKIKRNVKFDFDKDDENKIVDNENHKGLQLAHRRTIAITPKQKFFLCLRRFAGHGEEAGYSKTERENAQLTKLYYTGKSKIDKDFDILKIMKDLHEYRILFNYVKNKHSNLMIDVNRSRWNAVNLERDNWSTELERVEPYLTRHNTYQSSSSSDDNSDKSESRSASKSSMRTSSKHRSEVEIDPSSGSMKSRADEEVQEDPEDENEESVNTEQEVDMRVTVKPVDDMNADFDDIDESGDDDNRKKMQGK